MTPRRYSGILAAALCLGAPGAFAQSYIWTGPTVNTNWSTPGNWNIGAPPSSVSTNLFFGTNNPTAFVATVDTNYTLGTLEVTANAGPFILNSAGGVLTLASTFWNYSANAVTVSVAVGGAGEFYLLGTGTVKLTNTSNTYSGPTRVTNGFFTDGQANSFSPNSILMIASPGVANVTFNETVNGLSDDFSGGSGALTIASPATLTLGGPSITTYSGSINGGGSLQITGGGGLTLYGTANAYTGSTTISNGTLADGTNGALSPNSTVTLSGSGTLSVSYNEVIAGLQGAGGSVNLATSSGILSIMTPSNPAFAGTISGPGSLVIGGLGTQTLSGMSSYSGGTQVQSELFVGSSTNGPPGSFTAGPVGTGPLTFVFTAEFSPSANVTIANNIVFNDDVAYVDNDDGGVFNMTLTGQISGTSGFEWCTPGILELTGANTFVGGVDMREGTLLLGSSSVGGPMPSSPIGLGGLTLDSGTELAAAIPSVTLNNPINLTGNTQIGNGVTDDNALTLGGVISGNGALTYSAGTSGTLTLSGANTFTGNTMVAGGTVIAEGSAPFGVMGNSVILQGGGLDVGSGASVPNSITSTGTADPLTGSGTISSHVTIDNGFDLSPGDPLGILTFSNGLKLAANGTLTFKLYDAAGTPGTGYGSFNVTGGNLNVTASGGSFAFNVTTIDNLGNPAPALNFASSSSYSWMFGTAASITAFSPTDFTINTTGFQNATGGGFFSISNVGNNLFLNFTPVPEPTTWAMTALGIAVLTPFAISRRRRRRMMQA